MIKMEGLNVKVNEVSRVDLNLNHQNLDTYHGIIEVVFIVMSRAQFCSHRFLNTSNGFYNV